MDVRASAPGKLVLVGDYAVLDGAPAVVLALGRRAQVRVERAEDGFLLDAPDIGVHGLRGALHAGRLGWDGALASAQAQRLRLVSLVLQQLAARHAALAGARIRIDTRAFFCPDGSMKLGLGSSAAVTVALAGALSRLVDGAAPTLTELLTLHRGMQAGRGSGLDVAASLHGGVLRYQLRDGEPHLQDLAWPTGLGFCPVWSGRAASTAAALSRLALWRARLGGLARQLMGGLRSTALAVAGALEAGRIADIIEGLAIYAERLACLGEASGIDIVCREHRRLAAFAARRGLVYKTCGAGGGDVGVALGTDLDALADFRHCVAEHGFLPLDTSIDTRGLQLAGAP